MIQQKGVLHLDLFTPYKIGYDFSVIVTNKKGKTRDVRQFHQGRVEQEGLFAELKSYSQIDYIPVRGKVGNQAYLLSALLSHNLNREIQMQLNERNRKISVRRAALCAFDTLNRTRNTLIIKARRIVRPNGRFILSMDFNETLKSQFENYFQCFAKEIYA